MDTMIPVADLHCDLLLYLTSGKDRTPSDLEARCSLPQLQKGNVSLQTLAVFTETKSGSSKLGEKQFFFFSTLSKKGFIPLKNLEIPTDSHDVHIVAAIENASGLLEEDEPLELAFERLDRYQKLIGPILYISLTWNMENRFGGGNLSKVGLKKDGQRFLDFLSGKGIALDFSHTSDALAEGMLNYIDKKGLAILPLASHSNFRAITSHLRNLPDEIAQEIVKKGGVIGFNAVRKFVGDPFVSHTLRHIEHAAKLGITNNLCFGADFFFLGDLPSSLQPLLPMFDPEFEDASSYPVLMKHLRTVLSENEIVGMASQNLANFFSRLKGEYHADRR